MFGWFRSRFTAEVGIDLGTANTLVYVKGQGIVIEEPSVVTVKNEGRKVMAIGDEAKRMLGRTPIGIQAIRPMRDGVIADFEIVEKMIRYFIKKVHNNRRPWMAPIVAIGVPSGITPVEKRAVEESALRAGCRECFVVPESFAAALGAGINVDEPAGNLMVDIGGGTTEVSVISLGDMVVSNCIRVGGTFCDETIVNFIRKQHGLIIGEPTAERIKVQMGDNELAENLHTPEDDGAVIKVEREIEVRGRAASNGLPKAIRLDAEEIISCLADPINQIVEVIKSTLDATPPELSADIVDRGIIMTGGGAMLWGLADRIFKETGVPVKLAENPLHCVVLGTAKYLELKLHSDLDYDEAD